MPLAFEPYELTADFVVGLDQYALDDARLALASTIRRFEERFEAVNGRKPTRQEMGPLADEIRALVVVANERKRRDRLGRDAGARAGERAAKGPPHGAQNALLEQATAGAQNAALTRELMAAGAAGGAGVQSGTDGGAPFGAGGCGSAAADAIATGGGGLDLTFSRARSLGDGAGAIGGMRGGGSGGAAGGAAGGDGACASCCAPGMPFSASAELLVSWVQFLSLVEVLFARGAEALALRGVRIDELGWVREWRQYMAWTALFNLDFTLVAELYPQLGVLTAMSWGGRYLLITVALPLAFAFTTVLLIKDLPSVLWLLVLTASLLATIFVIAAKAILGAEQSNPAYDGYLAQTDLILYISVIGLFLCAATYAAKKVLALRERNRALLSEIAHLRSAGGGVVHPGAGGAGGAALGFAAGLGGLSFGGHGYGLVSPGSSPASSPAPSPRASPSVSPSRRNRVSSFATAAAADDDDADAAAAAHGRSRCPTARCSTARGSTISASILDGGGGGGGGGGLSTARGMGVGALRPATAAEAAEYELALHMALEQSVAEPPKLVALLRSSSLIFVTAVCTLFALLRLLVPPLFATIAFSARGAVITLALAATLLALLSTSTSLSLFRAGRRFLEHATLTFRSYYIGFLLIVLQMLYIPVTKALLSVWNCRQTACAPGQWYPVASPTLSGAATLDDLRTAATSCQPCPFYPRGPFPDVGGGSFAAGPDATDARAHCPLAAQLCPGSSSLRLVDSPDVECSLEIWPFTGIASALMLFVFTLGTPFLYAFLIREHSRRYRALPADPAADDDDQWAWRVQLSVANKARNLYADFEYRFRYYKIGVLLQKLLLVAVLVYVSDFPVLAAAAFVLIHGIFLGVSCVMRPYLDPRPDTLAIAVSLVSTFNPAMALIAFLGIALPDWMGFCMLVVNVVTPIAFLIVGFGCRTRQRRQKAKAAARRARESMTDGSEEGIVPWDPDAQYLRLARVQVDRGINEYTMRFLVNFFACVVVFCFVCAAVILLGWFHTAVKAPVTGTLTNSTLPTGIEPCVLEQAVVRLEFLQYGNWRDFTDNCCCMPREYKGDTPLIELWACANGQFKERMRRESATAPISAVRAFCGTVFLERREGGGLVAAPEVVPEWDGDAQRVGVPFDGGVVYEFW